MTGDTVVLGVHYQKAVLFLLICPTNLFQIQETHAHQSHSLIILRII